MYLKENFTQQLPLGLLLQHCIQLSSCGRRVNPLRIDFDVCDKMQKVIRVRPLWAGEMDLLVLCTYTACNGTGMCIYYEFVHPRTIPAFRCFKNYICSVGQKPHRLLAQLISWNVQIHSRVDKQIFWRMNEYFIETHLSLQTTASRKSVKNSFLAVHRHLSPVRRTASSEDRKRTLSHSASRLSNSFNVCRLFRM